MGSVFHRRCGCGQVIGLRESCAACTAKKRAELHAAKVCHREEQCVREDARLEPYFPRATQAPEPPCKVLFGERECVPDTMVPGELRRAGPSSQERWDGCREKIQALGFTLGCDVGTTRGEWKALATGKYGQAHCYTRGRESAKAGGDMEYLLRKCVALVANAVGRAEWKPLAVVNGLRGELGRVRQASPADYIKLHPDSELYGLALGAWLAAGLITNEHALDMAVSFTGYPPHSKPGVGMPLWDPVAGTWGLMEGDTVFSVANSASASVEGFVDVHHFEPTGRVLFVRRMGPRGFAVLRVTDGYEPSA